MPYFNRIDTMPVRRADLPLKQVINEGTGRSVVGDLELVFESLDVVSFLFVGNEAKLLDDGLGAVAVDAALVWATVALGQGKIER